MLLNADADVRRRSDAFVCRCFCMQLYAGEGLQMLFEAELPLLRHECVAVCSTECSVIHKQGRVVSES